MKGAFDNAKWPTILDRLIRFKVPGNLVRIIGSYLVGRQVLYQTSEGRVSKNTSQGCVRGSIASPTLWNILLDDISTIELPEEVKLFAFDDDVTVVAKHSDPKHLARQLNLCLSRVNAWGR